MPLQKLCTSFLNAVRMQVLHLVALHVLFVALAFYAVLVSAQKRIPETHGPGAALSDLLQGMSARWTGSSTVGAMHAHPPMMSQMHVCRRMHVKFGLPPVPLTNAAPVVDSCCMCNP